MKIEVRDEDLPMLLKMVERGWAEGDLAEYLDVDQIQACERALKTLGINQPQPFFRPTAHSQGR